MPTYLNEAKEILDICGFDVDKEPELTGKVENYLENLMCPASPMSFTAQQKMKIIEVVAEARKRAIEEAAKRVEELYPNKVGLIQEIRNIK